MEKRKYKNLLMLRQNQELMFFQMIKHFNLKGRTVRDIIEITHIPYKRAWYILEKWCNKGWYNYGITLDLGWLTIDCLPINNNLS